MSAEGINVVIENGQQRQQAAAQSAGSNGAPHLAAPRGAPPRPQRDSHGGEEAVVHYVSGLKRLISELEEAIEEDKDAQIFDLGGVELTGSPRNADGMLVIARKGVTLRSGTLSFASPAQCLAVTAAGVVLEDINIRTGKDPEPIPLDTGVEIQREVREERPGLLRVSPGASVTMQRCKLHGRATCRPSLWIEEGASAAAHGCKIASDKSDAIVVRGALTATDLEVVKGYYSALSLFGKGTADLTEFKAGRYSWVPGATVLVDGAGARMRLSRCSDIAGRVLISQGACEMADTTLQGSDAPGPAQPPSATSDAKAWWTNPAKVAVAAGGALTASKCTFKDCAAGYALAVEAGGTAQLAECTFSGNEAAILLKAAARSSSSSSSSSKTEPPAGTHQLTAEGCVFTGNQRGGLRLYGDAAAAAHASVITCSLTNCRMEDGTRGIELKGPRAVLTANKCTVRAMKAKSGPGDGQGVGISIDQGSSAELIECTLADNACGLEVRYAGDAANAAARSAPVTKAIKCTFQGNTRSGAHGAGHGLVLEGCTFERSGQVSAHVHPECVRDCKLDKPLKSNVACCILM